MRAICDDEDYALMEIFNQILQIEVFDDDQLPRRVCEQCIDSVTSVEATIRAYRDNDERLRKQLQEANLVQVKTELVEFESTEYLLEPDVSLEKTAEEETEEDYLDSLEDSKDFEKRVIKDEKLLTAPRKQDARPAIKRRKDKVGRRRGTKDCHDKPRKGDFRCYVCKSDSFGDPGALLAHLEEQHSGELPFTCTVCVHKTVVITNVHTLNVHKRMHANPTPCPHCDSRFANKRSLDLHITMLHQEVAPDETPSTCAECGKVFLTKKALRFHMNSHEPGMACEVCGKVFKTKMLLTRHVKRVHAKADRVECHICHKTLISLHSLQMHITIMHKNEQYKCKYCPRIYPSKASLTYHEKQHELNPKYTETMSNKWRQYYTVEGEKGDQKKTCNLCGVVLGSAIRHHYTTKHFPEAKRENRCEQCDATFKLKKDLEVHMLEHTLGKFLKCPICGKEFGEKRYLVWHMKTKKHRDHPLAQSLDWIESELPTPSPKRVSKAESQNVIVADVYPDMGFNVLN